MALGEDVPGRGRHAQRVGQGAENDVAVVGAVPSVPQRGKRGAFHQDPEHQPIYQELLKFGPNFVFAVNAIALELAGCILDLDDVIADAMGEPRVQRIGGS